MHQREDNNLIGEDSKSLKKSQRVVKKMEVGVFDNSHLALLVQQILTLMTTEDEY
jgi:hypothetical protein